MVYIISPHLLHSWVSILRGYVPNLVGTLLICDIFPMNIVDRLQKHPFYIIKEFNSREVLHSSQSGVQLSVTSTSWIYSLFSMHL